MGEKEDELQARIEELEVDLKKMEDKKDEAESEKYDLESERDELEEKLDDLGNDKSDVEEELELLKDKHEEMISKIHTHAINNKDAEMLKILEPYTLKKIKKMMGKE
ncbi:MAG: hypothetical protein ACYCS1_05265 [Gammaproteobacteria bacterium]